jgi:hypothetical protein
MTTTLETSLTTDQTHNANTLPGYVSKFSKANVTYGVYYKDTYVKDGKTSHHYEYLGRILNENLGIYYSKERGVFSFDLVNGYGNAPAEYNNITTIKYPQQLIARFGDAWMVDQIYKQTHLDSIFECLIPNESDTLKALVNFRVLNHGAYYDDEVWYQKSYAKFLYPNARLESP